MYGTEDNRQISEMHIYQGNHGAVVTFIKGVYGDMRNGWKCYDYFLTSLEG